MLSMSLKNQKNFKNSIYVILKADRSTSVYINSEKSINLAG